MIELNDNLISLKVSTLSPCAQIVYNILNKELLKPIEIERKIKYSSRSIRSALKLLQKNNLIDKYLDYNDLRTHFFRAK